MEVQHKQICRLCLTSEETLLPLFDSPPENNLLSVIRDNVGLNIQKDDAFSQQICKQCVVKLQTIAAYVELFHESDRNLRKTVTIKSLEPDNDASNNLNAQNVGETETLSSNAIVDEAKANVTTCTNNAVNNDHKQLSIEHRESTNTTNQRSERRCARLSKSTVPFETVLVDAESSDDFGFDSEDVINNVDPTEHTSSRNNSPSPNALAVTQPCEKEKKPKTKPKRQKRETISSKTKRNVKPNMLDVPMLHDFKCYICTSEPLGSRKALIEHLATHVDKVPHTCEQCVKETVVLTRVRTLNTHMKMHAQPIKCDYCDRRYSNAAGKYYHTQSHHLGGGAPCQVKCETCGKQYGSAVALKQHMKYHTTTLKCSKCDMVFNHPNKRRNHELTHDETRGFECVVCKKVLQTLESYDVHLKKHSQERSYPCKLCPKKFNTSFNLILHLKVHANNYDYRPARSWVEHYTILSRDPTVYKCNHCERYSTDKVNNMISHLQGHFKEYECDRCKRMFATAKQLRAHYTTHTGEKSEMCQHCGKCFSTKNNLRIHLKSHDRDADSSKKVGHETLDAVKEPCEEPVTNSSRKAEKA